MSNAITYVIGHKNPDTDSICSAISLAELKRAEGMENVVAARAGNVNPQTSFILDYFKMQPPKYLSSVHPRAKDIMVTEIVSVSEKTPLFSVMEIMREQNIRFIPVLDKDRKPKGVITLMELAKSGIARTATERAREVFTSVGNIVETLQGKLLTDIQGDDERPFSFYVGAMGEESFLKVLGDRDPKECAVIVGDRERIQEISVERGIGLIIITGGLSVAPSIVEAARAAGSAIVLSPYDSATTALIARLSTPVHRVCNTDFIAVDPDETVETLRQSMTRGGERARVILDGEGALQGVITKSRLLSPSQTRLILVDHNELSQAVDGADKVNICEIVDHHRLGNFHTTYPITFICEPVGSTSTLVSELYRRKGIPPRKEIAGLLLAGVLSDTVILKSPTTTDRDREIVTWLEEASGLNHLAFGEEIFTATSSIKTRGTASVVNGDYKTFTAGGSRFGIGQVETVGFNEFYEERKKLEEELTKLKMQRELKLSALLVTDIVLGTSLFLVVGDTNVVRALDFPRLEKGVYELKNVISRKKQVAPHIISLFNEIFQ
ncbi:MAG: putative manganese-dependent inorganic diphosphatase [Thermodesulfobacteriota bacterium]